MVQRTEVILTDDLDGRPATKTRTITLDGTTYEIDLSKKNSDQLDKAIGPYLEAASRKVNGDRIIVLRGDRLPAKAAITRRALSTVSPKPTNGSAPAVHERTAARQGSRSSKVRAWAKENGYEVSDRGRLSVEVNAAFDAAHNN